LKCLLLARSVSPPPGLARGGSVTGDLYFRANLQRNSEQAGRGPWANPKPLWQFAADDPVGAGAVATNGVVYFSSWDHHLFAAEQTNEAL
jgi:hypothetical protein